VPGGLGSVATRTVSACGAVSLDFSVLALLCALLSGCSSLLVSDVLPGGEGPAEAEVTVYRATHGDTARILCRLRDRENDIGGGCG
jgi:hypothetical protein